MANESKARGFTNNRNNVTLLRGIAALASQVGETLPYIERQRDRVRAQQCLQEEGTFDKLFQLFTIDAVHSFMGDLRESMQRYAIYFHDIGHDASTREGRDALLVQQYRHQLMQKLHGDQYDAILVEQASVAVAIFENLLSYLLLHNPTLPVALGPFPALCYGTGCEICHKWQVEGADSE